MSGTEPRTEAEGAAIDHSCRCHSAEDARSPQGREPSMAMHGAFRGNSNAPRGPALPSAWRRQRASRSAALVKEKVTLMLTI